jgi:hypothetical protein
MTREIRADYSQTFLLPPSQVAQDPCAPDTNVETIAVWLYRDLDIKWLTTCLMFSYSRR